MTEESGVPGNRWGGRCGKAGATRTGTVGSRVLSKGSCQGRGPCSCIHSLSHANPPSHPAVHPFPTHSPSNTSLVSVGPSLRLPTVPPTRPLSHPWPHTHSLPPIRPLSHPFSHPPSLLPNCSPSLYFVHHLTYPVSYLFTHPPCFSCTHLTHPLSYAFFTATQFFSHHVFHLSSHMPSFSLIFLHTLSLIYPLTYFVFLLCSHVPQSSSPLPICSPTLFFHPSSHPLYHPPSHVFTHHVFHPPSHPLYHPPSHVFTHPAFHPSSHLLYHPPSHLLTHPVFHPSSHPLYHPPSHLLTHPVFYPSYHSLFTHHVFHPFLPTLSLSPILSPTL